MEEWQKHVRHTQAGKENTAWCGVTLYFYDWAFLNIDHAIYTVARNDYAQPCPACVAKIVETLTKE